MDVVRQHELFDLDTFCEEPALQIDCLMKLDGPIVVLSPQ